MFNELQRQFIARHVVARLATSDRAGVPHVIPVCFAFDGVRFFTPIDEKPKKVAPARLKRVTNITANPRVSLVIDEYSTDWAKLAYVLVQGCAHILEGGTDHRLAVRLLRDRYEQYRSMDLEGRLVLAITPENVVAWGAVS